MGTDINMYAEVRRQHRWELAEPLERNSLWSEEAEELGPAWKPKELYLTRNYELFAILANVTNPIRSLTPLDYISEPRGLPQDSSEDVRDWHTSWQAEAFCESWLRLDELTSFDWHGKQIMRRGVVDPAAAHLFPHGRRGFPYADWPKGLTISVGNQGRGVEVNWLETYAEAVGPEFLNESLGKLRSYGSPQDVRIVFWFDQ